MRVAVEAIYRLTRFAGNEPFDDTGQMAKFQNDRS